MRIYMQGSEKNNYNISNKEEQTKIMSNQKVFCKNKTQKINDTT